MTKLKLRKKKSDKRKWMSLDEVIDYLMNGGYTRQQAMDLLAAKVEGGEIRAQRIKTLPESRLATDSEIENHPDNVGIGLGYFIMRFGLDPNEVQAELAAGRLRASCNSSVQFSSMVGEDVHADDFFVSKQAIEDWIRHPETPPHMIMQACEAMETIPRDVRGNLVIRREGNDPKN